MNVLHVRWLGTVAYHEAWSLQRALHDAPGRRPEQRPDHLLLLEHPHTYTLGRHADPRHVLVDPAVVGAELVHADRGGDVTYHGPGQLVGYPIVTLSPDLSSDRAVRGSPTAPAGPRDYVGLLEDVLIDAIASLGLGGAGRHDGHPGVWVEPNTPSARKVAQIGVRIERGRTLHGLALNVAPDMTYFDQIVPCGITDLGVTSLAREGLDVTVRQAVDALADAFARRWGARCSDVDLVVDRADVVWRRRARDGGVGDGDLDDADLAPFSRGLGPGEPMTGANEPVGAGRPRPGTTSVRLRGRLAEAGVTEALELTDRKPDWMRSRVQHTAGVLDVKRTVRDLGLVTVCEEAGCPNLSECWSDGTATFMVLGERCTRACGFCLVDTRHPETPAPDEPERVAEAVARMDLAHAVVTMVARDDLADGGAAHVAATVRAIRARRPGTRVEVLISDLKGDVAALEVVLGAEPDVVNHNVETVARLQRAVRPSAGYARWPHHEVRPRARTRRVGLRGRVDPRGPRRGRRVDRDHRSVPASDLAPPAGRAVVDARGLRAVRGGRPRPGVRPRRVEPVHALQLPRPYVARRGGLRRGRRRAVSRR